MSATAPATDEGPEPGKWVETKAKLENGYKYCAILACVAGFGAIFWFVILPEFCEANATAATGHYARSHPRHLGFLPPKLGPPFP
ncbi:hypothetical protein FOCG_09152 [Fusarium oxysporum f. sp. radicis-lycopersici 26381]|uniref:Uncharacterized protein n=1 Tax=Fusarium oxysporum Fo47 TaxID=660027 RepID=W9K9T7_FUSOX|nr:hypothetical protein FOZG_08562 [Fusarium oxysporum Fo47]EXL51026.1 hypothetical protein FOCG_09152 [Fusarium oxysporum f. sp. radicis-lycopersici 26381]RKL44458.1 hypothetical protein BFJ70_g3600 [Fusarium oxysporum]